MIILDILRLKRYKNIKPKGPLQYLLDNPNSFNLIGGCQRSVILKSLSELGDANSDYLATLLFSEFYPAGDYLVFESLPNLNPEGKMSFDILKDYCFTNWDGNTDIDIKRETSDGDSGQGDYRYIDFYVDEVKVRYIFQMNPFNRHEFILVTKVLVHNAETWARKNLNRFGLRRLLGSIPGI